MQFNCCICPYVQSTSSCTQIPRLDHLTNSPNPSHHANFAGNQDVMVVVQCATQPQLRTLAPASSAATDSIKAFADSITKKTGDKLIRAYRRISGSNGTSTNTLDQFTIKQWRNQTALMWVWLLSSLVVVMFAPLFVAPGALLLASLTASALGVIAVVMHSLGDRLAETGEGRGEGGYQC